MLENSYKCIRCRATNRQRQIAYFLYSTIAQIAERNFSSLKSLASFDSSNFVLYNTEANGAVHNQLSKVNGYIYSEYFGSSYKSGEVVNGVIHQDLMQLSFADESIDIAMSSDVFEHIPDPYKAHQELFRVLKHGGRHIFTVPFNPNEYLDDHRARLDDQGDIIYLKEPVYHGDPLDQEKGILVYNTFALEMLVELKKIGFKTNLYVLRGLFWRGIVGPDAIIFEAVKD